VPPFVALFPVAVGRQGVELFALDRNGGVWLFCPDPDNRLKGAWEQLSNRRA
jgi:hypothetical protein